MIIARTSHRWITKQRPCLLIGLIIGLGFNASTTARESQSPAPESFAIVGARLYSSPDATPFEDSVVVMQDGRIVGAGSRANTPVPSGTRLLDVHGAVLTAEFWNCHIHFMTPDVLKASTANAETLKGALQAMLTLWGFTTVFDLASSTDNTLALRQRINSGEILGPMILTVGDPFFPKDGTPIYVRDFLKSQGWPSEEVATPKEAAARAARQLDRGMDGVKIFAGAIVGGRIAFCQCQSTLRKPSLHKRINAANLAIATKSDSPRGSSACN
jgi:imidazolonepropionase-like amidohydrolase